MKMTKIMRIALYIVVGIFSIPTFTMAATATPVVGGSDLTGADANTSSVTVPTSVVVGGSSSTGSDSNTSSIVAPTGIVVGGGSSTGADANTSTGSINNGGGSTNTSGGSSSSSGGRAMILTAITPISASTSCNYLSGYMKLGANNDSSEVSKLQSFLKNIENINVDINGIFDTKTFEGVKAFQAKYLNDTMGPWGVNTPSGQVFYTTKKKINEVYCKSPFALTSEQLSEINAYKNAVAQGNTPAIVGENVGANSNEINVTATGTSPLSPEVGSINDNSAQTASAVNTSFGTKISNFFKWLFGY